MFECDLPEYTVFTVYENILNNICGFKYYCHLFSVITLALLDRPGTPVGVLVEGNTTSGLL